MPLNKDKTVCQCSQAYGQCCGGIMADMKCKFTNRPGFLTSYPENEPYVMFGDIVRIRNGGELWKQKR